MHFKKNKALVTSTTGVSATLIGGVTAHSALSLPLGVATQEDLKNVGRRYRAIFKKDHPVEIVFVDEISQFGPETYDSLLKRKRRISRTARNKNVRLILSGDFSQILNVVKEKDKNLVLDRYGSTRLLNSEVFNNHEKKIFVLDVNKRSRDPVLTSMLSKMRLGEDKQAVVDYFNQNVREPDPEAVVITTTNAAADIINQKAYDANPKMPMFYHSKVSGDFNTKDSNVPDVVALKEGLRVMILTNDTENEEYVNGSIGILESCMLDSVQIRLDNGKLVEVGYTKQENKEYYTDEEDNLCTRVVGKMEALQVAICYAVTSHKMQGQTVEKATLDFSGGAFAAGQLFVACSRLTNFEGLTLTAPLSTSDIIVDPTVKTFYKKLRGEDYNPAEDTDHLPEEFKKYKIRVIIAGGRDFNDYNYMKKSMDFMLKRFNREEILIVEGGAKGADKLGRKYAMLHDIDYITFEADWKDITTPPVKIKRNAYGEYNVLAGMVRNKQMGDFASHLVVYWDGVSSGTDHMKTYMQELGKPVKVFKY
jgi:hypothetical protein